MEGEGTWGSGRRVKQKQREVKSRGKKRERVLGAGREGRQVTIQVVTETVTDTHGHRHWTHGTGLQFHATECICIFLYLFLPSLSSITPAHTDARVTSLNNDANTATPTKPHRHRDSSADPGAQRQQRRDSNAETATQSRCMYVLMYVRTHVYV